MTKIPTIGMEVETTVYTLRGARANDSGLYIPLKKEAEESNDVQCAHKGSHTRQCIPDIESTETTWGFQHDTDGEYRSPWCTNIDDFSTYWIKFWRRWFRVNPDKAPVMHGMSSPYSGIIGQHHHLGLKNGDLSNDDREKITKLIDRYSPLLIAIYANSPGPATKSRRMERICGISGNEADCESYDDDYRPVTPINKEGSDNSNTIEVRTWDANYPQVALTVFEIEKLLMLRAFSGKPSGVTMNVPIDETLDEQILHAIKNGFGRNGIVARPYIKSLIRLGLETRKQPINSILRLANHRMNLRDYLRQRRIITIPKEAKISKELILNPKTPPEDIIG